MSEQWSEAYYEQWSIEALEERNTQLSNERAAIKQEQKRINAVLDRKRAEQPRVDSQSAQVNVAGIRARLEDGE